MSRPRVLCSTALAVCLWAAPGAAFGPDVTASGAAFRFVVMNDVHISINDLNGSRDHLHAAIDELNSYASEFDFVLVAGDLAQGKTLPELNTELGVARGELDRLVVPYYVTIGNRDVTPGGDDSAFRSFFGEPTLRVQHKGLQIASLNTVGTQTSTHIQSQALAAFEYELSKIARTDPLVVFSHHPLGPLAPFGPDNRQSFYTVIDGYNLRGAFSGQYQALFEEQRNGVWYTTSRAIGLQGCNHDGTCEKGYRLVTVWPDFTLSSEFFTLGQPPHFGPSPPSLTHLAPRYALVGRPLALQVGAAHSASTDKYAVTNLPAGATFDAASRIFAWTPAANQVGLHPNIQFTVSNPGGTNRVDTSLRVLGSACVADNFAPSTESWSPYGGAWLVQNGVMVQIVTSGGSYYNVAPPVLSDFYCEADLRQTLGKGYAGLIFRYIDPRNNYYLWSDGNTLALKIRINGKAFQIGHAVPVNGFASWKHLRIEAIGDNIKVYCEGELVIDVHDATFASGHVGVVCSQAAAEVDNFVAVGCPDLPNHAPVLQPIGNVTAYKGVPLTLQLVADDPDQDPLAFTATDLPERARVAARRGVFLWTPTANDVGSVHRVTFSVTDGELLDTEQVVINVIDPAQACIWKDFAPGPLEEIELPPTGPPIVPDTTWVERSGHLIGRTPDTITNILVPEHLEDYTVETRLRVDGSDYGNLMFRVVDDGHYYYLYTDSATQTIDIRRRDGDSFTILGSGAPVCSDIDGRWHHYRVQVLGDIIRLWVDGDRRYELRDPELQGGYLSGGVGLRVKRCTLTVDYISIHDCTQAVVPEQPETAEQPDVDLSDVGAFPNPFNPTTTVHFRMSRPGAASVCILDAAGRLVRRLVDAQLPQGPQQVVWDGRNSTGEPAASGVYYLRIQTPAQRVTRNLVLVK